MDRSGPYLDYLRPRGLTWIKATLRVTVAIQCFGAAAQTLSLGVVSPVAQFLAEYGQWSEEQAAHVDTIAAYALAGCGLLCALRPVWPVLIAVSVWFCMTALAPLAINVDRSLVFSATEHTLRCLSPLALLVLDFWPPALKSHLGRTVIAMWMLRIAMAGTFIGIGLTSINDSVTSGSTLTLLNEVAERSGVEVGDDATGAFCLGAVGALSVALGFNLLTTRSKPMLVVAMAWGFLCALVRIADLGLAGFPEVLVRAAQVGAPLDVLLYYSLSIKEFPPEVVAEN